MQVHSPCFRETEIFMWCIYEIKKIIFSKRMFIGILLGFLMLLVGGWEDIGSVETDFLEAYMMAYADSPTAFLSLLFPIIAVLPYGTSAKEERDSGMYALLISKMHPIRYVSVKVVVSIVSGALVIGIPNALYYLYCMIRVGLTMSDYKNCLVRFMPAVYEQNPVLYGWILVGNTLICGAIMSVLSLGVGVWVKNKYIGMLIPFAYYFISAAILAQINPDLNAVNLYFLNGRSYFSGKTVIWYDCILLFTGIAGIAYKVWREFEKGIIV